MAVKIRLAQSAKEVRMAQRLRHDVFIAESPSNSKNGPGFDADKYDAHCAHLLVIDPDDAKTSLYPLAGGALVATTRLIGQSEAQALGGFYSASEFDLAELLKRKSDLKFLELGRTCILKSARGSAVMELLWQGIWDFVRRHSFDVMIGCASFEGVDPALHCEALRFLAQHAKAPEDWHVNALPGLRVNLPDAAQAAVDPKRILARLPPLIKGYLRLGCYIGDGCVVDRAFNTVDVLIILPVKAINPRYFARFGAPA